MKCENCGAEVTEGRFCNYCGSEYEREERINRINYKREYDAWFDSLSEAEKQTELMRRMVEKNR